MNVKTRLLIFTFVFGYIGAATTPLRAHHAFAAEFDGSKAIRLSGSLTKIEWANPHTYFYIEVKDSTGKTAIWGCEAASPGALSRRGFKRADLKIGDMIVIDGYPAKDGSRLMDARRITLADGRIVSGGSAGDGGPGSDSRRPHRHNDMNIGQLAAVAFLVSSTLFAQDAAKASKPAPRAADKHPDLTGYWKGMREKFNWNIAKDQPGMKPPLTPAGEAALKHNQTATIDPESLCILGGTPRHNVSNMPYQIMQSANKLAFLYSDGAFRLIPIDPKRKHSEDIEPSFFGEEIAHWEGDTLVIDSKGFKDEKIWIDEYANPSSDALHVVEKWTRPDDDHIHVETLIDDPKFYSKTITYSRTWVTGSPDEEIAEFSCSENNVDLTHLGFGPGPIRKDGTIGYEDPAPLPPPLPRTSH